MKYPLYNKKGLQSAGQDGNYPVSDFASFILQLIEQDVLENETEKGITAFVNTNGTQPLSEKQGKVLDIIVSRYDNDECKVCGERIPLSEVLSINENDGLCSYHKHQFDKENNL